MARGMRRKERSSGRAGLSPPTCSRSRARFCRDRAREPIAVDRLDCAQVSDEVAGEPDIAIASAADAAEEQTVGDDGRAGRPGGGMAGGLGGGGELALTELSYKELLRVVSLYLASALGDTAA